jgi:hypothetical protein
MRAPIGWPRRRERDGRLSGALLSPSARRALQACLLDFFFALVPAPHLAPSPSGRGGVSVELHPVTFLDLGR